MTEAPAPLNSAGEAGDAENTPSVKPADSQRRRRWWVIGLIVLAAPLLILGFMLFVDWWMEYSARDSLHAEPEEVPKHRVALVLGAKVYPSGQLSAMLYDRVKAGVELYKAGRVEKLLMSGDNSETHYDEVTAMRRAAIEMGVPSDDVVRDFAGFRTWDSLVRARDLWNLRDLVIVSQRFHLPRALFLARGLGLNADGYIADRPSGYPISGRQSRLREIPARSVAWQDRFILRPKPHFLGPPEGLSGDSQRDVPPRRRPRDQSSQSAAPE